MEQIISPEHADSSTQVSLVSCFAYCRGIRWHWRQSQVCGPNDPILVIHDLVLGPSGLDRFAETLKEFAPVYFPDLPGFGLTSSELDEPMGVRELSDAIAEWMDAVSLEPVHIVANAFGCQVAAELAACFPEHVKSLALAGPTLDPAGRGLVARSVRFLCSLLCEPVRLAGRRLIRQRRQRAQSTIQLALEHRIEEKLPEISVPSLVLRGRNDAIAPKRWTKHAARLLQNGLPVTLPAGSHYVGYSHPDLVAAVERRFTESLACVDDMRRSGSANSNVG